MKNYFVNFYQWKNFNASALYINTLSKRYDVLLTKCVALAELYKQECELAKSLDDRYKKSDAQMKTVDTALYSICNNLNIQKSTNVEQPSMQKTLKRSCHFYYVLSLCAGLGAFGILVMLGSLPLCSCCVLGHCLLD